MFLPALTAGVMSLALIQGQPSQMPTLLQGMDVVASPTVRERLMDRREEFLKRWEAVKERRQDKLQSMRERLKERLENVPDERKQVIAENLAERLNAVNDTHANNELRFLEKNENLLVKIEERASALKNKGADISAVTTAIANAQGDISNAKEAVLAQKDKVYSLDQNSTEPIGKTFAGLVSQMNRDHQALRNDSLKTAKNSVRSALMALKDAAKSFNDASTEGDEE